MSNENAIKKLLIELGVSTEDSIAPYFSKVRDQEPSFLSVLKCKKSGVILLSRTDHADVAHYSEKKHLSYHQLPDRRTTLLPRLEDALRRREQFQFMIANKKWLDIGTGVGGILDLLSPVALETAAVEPQEAARNILISLGYQVYSSIEEAKENNFDAVTLFHVLEHFVNPVETLKSIKSKMAKGGRIIVEAPHAKDFLISFFEHEAFKYFTFWSEHLVLHTRDSLRIFLEAAGFSNIVIKGFQRYPLANHLHWLSREKPNGHNIWPYLRTPELDKAYADMLSNIDKTDTLIAIAENL